jgi:hypothetical protein
VTQPALIPWGARDYWQGIGFQPSPPAEPINPTRDPALTAAAEEKPPAPKKAAPKAESKSEQASEKGA